MEREEFRGMRYKRPHGVGCSEGESRDTQHVVMVVVEVVMVMSVDSGGAIAMVAWW